MTRIELIIEEGQGAIDFYLSEISSDEFKKDISELKSAYSDKEALKKAIYAMQKIIGE